MGRSWSWHEPFGGNVVLKVSAVEPLVQGSIFAVVDIFLIPRALGRDLALGRSRLDPGTRSYLYSEQKRVSNTRSIAHSVMEDTQKNATNSPCIRTGDL